LRSLSWLDTGAWILLTKIKIEKGKRKKKEGRGRFLPILYGFMG
jgi:hypothetical protein